MQVYAIGDLHMPGATGKRMDVFGEHWRGHLGRVSRDWDERVGEEDVVLVAGDLSWALRLDEAREDLAWLGRRPGRKILIRGNHDHWWNAIGKVRQAMPERCYALQNDVWCDEKSGLGVAGARLWDIPGFGQGDVFEAPLQGSPARSWFEPEDRERTERIYRRELGRLERSLSALPGWVEHRIALLHFPPTNSRLEATEVTELLEKHAVDHCVFGHLHALRQEITWESVRKGVHYHLVSADFVSFQLQEILELASGHVGPSRPRDHG